MFQLDAELKRRLVFSDHSWQSVSTPFFYLISADANIVPFT